MQGQRGTIGSWSETLEFDRGSASNNTQNDSLSGWSLGEPSSSNTQNEVNNDEQKRELGLSSSSIIAAAIAGPRLDERRIEVPTNASSLDNANMNPMYMCSSNSHLVSQNLNLNPGLADSGSGNSSHVEHTNLHKSIGPVNEHIPPTFGSGRFMLPSGSDSFFVEDIDGRSGCSLDTRRASCKRKAIERTVGQSSDSGSSTYSQHTDGSAWSTLPTQDSAGNSFNRSAAAEHVNARLGLSVRDGASESIPDLNVAGSSESFHRNFHLRMNPSSQQLSIPPASFSNGSVVRNSGVSSSSPVLPRFHPIDSSADLRSVPPADTTIPQSQPLLIHVNALPRNMQSFRWDGGSSSTNNHLSNSVICEDRDNLPHEEASSRNMRRNILEHPVFIPPTNLRNHGRIPTRASNAANLGIPGNAAASSRTGSSSSINPPPAPTWVSRSNPPQYPRRLSEYVRRSLFSPGSEATGSPSNNYSSLRGPSTSSESRGLSSGVNPGSSSWLERSGDSEFGIPYPLRSMALAGEGSSRLVSELRNVLGLMRRGGNLRIEDVMFLDHSVFSGLADIHDRHRDMRLDVDNMSYEELLALEERIGNVSTGLSEETILKLLKQKKYSSEPESQLETEPCSVCQEEYKDGDDIGSLDCGHDYHTHCIKQWLMHKNLCPICKTTGLAT